LRNNLFYTFVLSYIDKSSEQLKNKYQDNLKSFLAGFTITDEFINSFINFAKSKDVKINDEDFKKDEEYIRARLKAQIARNFWKNEGWYSVLLTVDEQLQKALTLFIEAKYLSNLK
jgi:carboxyl-terminal processing protease